MFSVEVLYGPEGHMDPIMPFVEMRVGDHTFRMLIDSGVDTTVLPLSLVKQCGLLESLGPADPDSPEVIVGSLGNTEFQCKTVNGEMITIYPYVFVGEDGPTIPLLGRDVLVNYQCCLRNFFPLKPQDSDPLPTLDFVMTDDLPEPVQAQMVTYTINGVQVTGLLDTGGTYNYITEEDARRCGLEIVDLYYPRRSEGLAGVKEITRYCPGVTIMVGSTVVDTVGIFIEEDPTTYNVFGMQLIIRFNKLSVTSDGLVLSELDD